MELDPEVQAVLDLAAAAGRPALNTVSAPEARAMYEQTASGLDIDPMDVAVVRDQTVQGSEAEIPVRLYRPTDDDSAKLPLLVFYHGGGWVIGSRNTHDPICRRMAANLGCMVINVDYRLAPEHPFPAAAIDSFDVLKWACENAAELGVDLTRVAVAGDSAGGNLSAVMAQMARDENLVDLVLQVLIYPVTTAERRHNSYKQFSEGYVLTKEMMDYFFDAYLGKDGPVTDPRMSPMLADDLSGLAPAEIIVAGFDPLRDEGIEYAQRLIEAGNKVALTNYSGVTHGFLHLSKMVGQSREMIDHIERSLKLAFAKG